MDILGSWRSVLCNYKQRKMIDFSMLSAIRTLPTANSFFMHICATPKASMTWTLLLRVYWFVGSSKEKKCIHGQKLSLFQLKMPKMDKIGLRRCLLISLTKTLLWSRIVSLIWPNLRSPSSIPTHPRQTRKAVRKLHLFERFWLFTWTQSGYSRRFCLKQRKGNYVFFEAFAHRLKVLCQNGQVCANDDRYRFMALIELSELEKFHL